MGTVGYLRSSSVRLQLNVSALVALELVIFFLYTRHGIGILPDSTRYMQISPTPYDAPLYSWLLGALHLLNVGYNEAAYGVGLVFLLINTAVILYILNYLCDEQQTFFIPAALLIVLSPQYVRAHVVAMSEPLFLCLSLASGLSLWRYLLTARSRWLYFMSVSVGLCMLARFSAAPLAAALASALLLFGPGHTVTARLRPVLLFGAVSGVIFLSWAVISKLLIGHSVGRSLWFNGNPDFERWQSGLNTLATFILPSQVPNAIRYPLTLGVLLVIIFLLSETAARIARQADRHEGGDRDRTIVFLGLLIIWYVAFLVLAVNIEAYLPLNSRYLLPVYLASVMLVFGGLGRSSAGFRPFVRLGALFFIVALAATSAVRLASDTYDAYHNGIGYQASRWFSSPTVLAVNRLPADAKIFSNAPDALNYLTGRRTELVPRRFERRTGVEDPANPQSAQIESLRQALSRGAYVVFVDHVDWRFYLTSEEELRTEAGLKLYHEAEDGRIYKSDFRMIGQNGKISETHN